MSGTQKVVKHGVSISPYRSYDEIKRALHATELERDDFHRELMDLRYQLEQAKA